MGSPRPSVSARPRSAASLASRSLERGANVPARPQGSGRREAVDLRLVRTVVRTGARPPTPSDSRALGNETSLARRRAISPPKAASPAERHTDAASASGERRGVWGEPWVPPNYAAPMRWTVHGERSLYESEWMRSASPTSSSPAAQRFEHHVVRMPHEAAGVGRPRPRPRRAAPVAAPLHHRHVGLGDPGRADRRRARRPSRRRRARRSRRRAGGPDRCAARHVPPAQRPSRSALPHLPRRRREHVGEPTDPSEAERIEWVPVGRARELIRSGEVSDGYSLTALLWALELGLV